jgi:trk system potassium uptake protein TrkA
VELEAPISMQGQSLRELDLRALYGINILAIKSDEEINAAPHATDIIRKGDILVLLGTGTGIHQLERKLQET